MLTVVSLLESKCQTLTRKGTEDQRSFERVECPCQKEDKLDKSVFPDKHKRGQTEFRGVTGIFTGICGASHTTLREALDYTRLRGARVRETDSTTNPGHPITRVYVSSKQHGHTLPPLASVTSAGPHRNGARKNRQHPPRYMTDTGAGHRGTWWQSRNNGGAETVQLDLESRFYFTHLVMVFRTPRPAAMVLERSSDYGKTWRTYSYFARNCTETFGLREGVNPEGSLCTSRYSDPDPCTRGEVAVGTVLTGAEDTTVRRRGENKRRRKEQKEEWSMCGRAVLSVKHSQHGASIPGTSSGPECPARMALTTAPVHLMPDTAGLKINPAEYF
ncbi:Ntn4p [Branchiostoma belcheri]|nr:Ntn4p [Branchiostoma belcheri]